MTNIANTGTSSSHLSSSSWGNSFLPLLLGIAAFFLVIGPNALDPTNIAWLQAGDPAQHYLGWAFFRYSPWTLPLGLNPNFGLDISSSIVYSDSIPLLAILFKPFSPWLPEPFQYIGIWYLLCFVLQAYFANALLGLITKNTTLKLLGTCFFILSPIMLWRMGVHAALSGHFLILAALYLTLKPHTCANTKTNLWWWVVLLGVLSSVHFYMLMMVVPLFVTSLILNFVNIDKLSLNYSPILKILFAFFVAVFLIASIMWTLGYFEVRSLTTMNYGIGRINALGLFDSHKWSYFLFDIPEVRDASEPLAREYESFVYLGSGLLLCLGFALWGLRYHQVCLKELLLKHRIFVIALGCLTLFALSNQIGIGPWGFTVPLPEQIISLASILRASARLFWPVYYALVLLILYVIIKSYSAKTAIIMLSVGLLIQVADTSAGWKQLRKQMMLPKASVMGTPLQDPFWQEAAKRYQKVLVVLPQDGGIIDWKTFADYAAKNRVPTNSAYLGRYDSNKMALAKAKLEQAVNAGKYDPAALYILENDKVIAAYRHYNAKTDLLARIDGFNVLAPGWKEFQLPSKLEKYQDLGVFLPQFSPLNSVLFSRDVKNIIPYVLVRSWYFPESWGTWALGNESTLVLPLPQSDAKSVTLTARAFVTPKHPTQDISIAVNGSPRQEVILTHDSNNQIVIPITKADQQAGYLNIHFHFKNPAKPKDLGIGDDDRLLSLGLISAIFD